MKRFVSLFAVAVLAVTFGAACGKYTKCDQATKMDKCVASEFEEGRFTGKCEWLPKGDPNGACKDVVAAWSANEAAVKACTEASAGEDACTAASAVATKAQEDVVCKWDDGAKPKCQAVKKSN